MITTIKKMIKKIFDIISYLIISIENIIFVCLKSISLVIRSSNVVYDINIKTKSKIEYIIKPLNPSFRILQHIHQAIFRDLLF